MNAEQRKRALDLVRRYGKQPTTWVGMFSLAGAFGLLHLTEEMEVQMAGAVAAVVGGLLVVFDEDKT